VGWREEERRVSGGMERRGEERRVTGGRRGRGRERRERGRAGWVLADGGFVFV